MSSYQGEFSGPGQEIPVHKGAVLFIARFFIIFGGVLPFIPQYFHIRRTNDPSGFSTYVCLVVVVSSILRIAYWLGHYFDLALLFQSIVMVLAMFVMLELCLRIERNRAREAGVQFRERTFGEMQFDMFWQWTDLFSYIQATFALLAVSGVYAYVLANKDFWIEPLGYIALLIEAFLTFPQLLKNYNAHSTVGMSVSMVVLWTLGDAAKGYFFFATNQPLPFRLCAVVQLVLDLGLFFQVATY